MQYEAKCDGDDCPGSSYGTNNLPISIPQTTPWTGLNLAEAKTACRKLGHKYDLISNEEWMTIARNAEVQASNWPSTVVGSGCIRKGNDSTPGTCGYDINALDFGTSRDTKARLTLSNGSQVWDLAGNAMEWVDWSQTSGLDLAPLTCTTADDEELGDVSCPALSANDYLPIGNYDSTDGIGMFFGENGGAPIRGGSLDDGSFGGLYALLIAGDTELQNANLGFRCVWRSGATPEIPTLAYEDGTVTVGINTDVTLAPGILLPNGSDITDCQITPALPAGFTLDSETCVISGFNNNGFATNTYSIIASNSIGDSAAASLTLASGACPDGFIAVPGNIGLGTDNFCVMQFEAKCQGTNCPSGPPSNDARAVSTASSLPWTGLDLGDAKLACTNMGARFDLISNQEWMTIARNVELQASNWPSGIVGTGCIKQGNNDNDDACGYDGGALLAGASRDNKSLLVLSNSSEIWDLSGNALEWVDWSFSTGLDLAPQTCISPDEEELGDVSCPALSANDYLPSGSYTSTHGVGMFYGDTGGAPIRGGSYSDGPFTGIYSLIISEEPTISNPSLGFRCVWRPD
jgi:formylglycine-generating enzyme required for sulfatase activity